MGERNQKIQIFGDKEVKSRDVTYSMVTLVYNIIPHI